MKHVKPELKVSVITVCFNSESCIADAIESVIHQSYSNLEYIIVDGGSTDSTLDIIQSYGSLISSVISGPDRGIYDAMNKGVTLSTGDIVAILNSDDFYLDSNTISDVVGCFEKHPEVGVVLGDVDFVRVGNLEFPVRFYSSAPFSLWKMRFGFMPPHPAAFVKRSIYESIGFYKIDYKIGADFEWFVRSFLINSVSFLKIDRTCVRMRLGGVSTAGIRSSWLSSKEQVRALRENNIYSNFLFVSVRLPFKFLSRFFHRLS